jgi:hypothetical protein
VTDTLPSSLLFKSVSTSQGTCSRARSKTPKGGTVTCNLSGLAAGGSATITIKVMATATGRLSDTANVTASNVTPDSDDTATATTRVIDEN